MQEGLCENGNTHCPETSYLLRIDRLGTLPSVILSALWPNAVLEVRRELENLETSSGHGSAIEISHIIAKSIHLKGSRHFLYGIPVAGNPKPAEVAAMHLDKHKHRKLCCHTKAPPKGLAWNRRGEAGTSMGHGTAAERFKAAAAVLRERDVEDRKDYQQRKRSKVAEAKAKKRARESEGGAAVTLGTGLGYPGEEVYEGRLISSEP